jgi:hypothetical protein
VFSPSRPLREIKNIYERVKKSHRKGWLSYLIWQILIHFQHFLNACKQVIDMNLTHTIAEAASAVAKTDL